MCKCEQCDRTTGRRPMTITPRGVIQCYTCAVRLKGHAYYFSLTIKKWVVSRVINGKREEFLSKDLSKAIAAADAEKEAMEKRMAA